MPGNGICRYQHESSNWAFSERREPSRGQTSLTREQAQPARDLDPEGAQFRLDRGPSGVNLGEAERARTISADRSLLLNRTSPRGPRDAMLA